MAKRISKQSLQASQNNDMKKFTWRLKDVELTNNVNRKKEKDEYKH